MEYLKRLISDIESGKPPTFSPETEELLDKAEKATFDRRNEDVEVWAEGLAEDMCDLND